MATKRPWPAERNARHTFSGGCPVAHAENDLEMEFIKDHQKLTRGFSRIIAAIHEDDWPAAVQAAQELNREGGPHIAFEEDVLYPRVAQSRSERSVRHLYDEHQAAISAVRFLLSHPHEQGIAPDAKARLLEQLQTGLDHAVSCGTLLSYLTVLDAPTQRDLLATLKQHRAAGKTMVELARPAA
jgi:hypothetical protein